MASWSHGPGLKLAGTQNTQVVGQMKGFDLENINLHPPLHSSRKSGRGSLGGINVVSKMTAVTADSVTNTDNT